MNQCPLLSIIIPVYNTEEYVDKCLKSVLEQTYKNIEVIIVDDASQGNIKEIVAEYQKSNKNIRLISHEKNKGLFLARVTGVKNAQGNFLAFVDSDDYVSADLYRKMIKKAIDTNSDIVITDYLEIWEDGTKYYANSTLQQVNIDLYNEEILSALMKQQGLDYGWWIWNKIYAKDLWEACWAQIKNQNEHLIMCEDVAFSITFFTYAKHLTNVHYDYYYYYRNSNSSTKLKNNASKYNKNLEDIKLSFNYTREVLKTSGNWKLYESEWKTWRNRILKSWHKRISEDTKIEKAKRNSLCNLIIEINENEKLLPPDKDESFFNSHGIAFKDNDKYQEIKSAIIDPQYRVISFDIFDTLILRPFWQPTDIFHVLDDYVNRILLCTDFFVFTDVRISAEKYARKLKHLKYPLIEDIDLNDIYSAIEEICPMLLPYLDSIKAKEIELELKYCNIRSCAKELLDLAEYCNKEVICISDMYLPLPIIRKILVKNNINVNQIYLSSEVGLTKISGNLYTYVQKKLGVKFSQIVHIGDNKDFDVDQAQRKGIKAYHFPKTVNIFMNADENIYSGRYFNKIFNSNLNFINGHSALDHWGNRCMMAMAANELFDNPFVIYDHNSDFNANPYTIGYFVLGMYIFSVSHWLMKETLQEKYDHIHFIARDGYLPMKAFEALNVIFNATSSIHYTFMSRKAVLPLMLQQNVDYYALYDACNDLQVLSPEKFINLFKPLIPKEKFENAQNICRENNFSFNGTFKSVIAFEQFGKIFINQFYNSEIFKEYYHNMKDYLDSDFTGKIATFDIGYNGRIESILSACYSYDITAHYIHTNGDRPFGRAQKNNIQIKTLYNFSPAMTGIMREHLLSKLAPSCIGYNFNTLGKGPLFEDYQVNYQTYIVTTMMQNAAIKFVKNMVTTFGNDIKIMPFRNYDACIPMEYYIHASCERDRHLFSATYFEDDMGIGRDRSLYDFWNSELHRNGSLFADFQVTSIDYANTCFVKRWLLILALDWGEGKKRIAYQFRHHPFLLELMRKTYRCAREKYRAAHKR